MVYQGCPNISDSPTWAVLRGTIEPHTIHKLRLSVNMEIIAEDWREAVAIWGGKEAFTGMNKAGVSLQMGGKSAGDVFSPMELLLVGLAGCTGMDVASILEKKRQNLQEFRVEVRGKRADQPPRVYTQIRVEYLLWGEDLDPVAVERAIELSEEKYCSASIMLGATAEISSTYRILKPGETIPEPDEAATR